MDTLTLLLLSLLPCLVIVAAIFDLTTMKIPNWISGLLILGFFPAALMIGLAPLVIATHVGIAIVALLLGMALFAMGVIGGGDAKLLAAASLWFGLSGVGVFMVWTAVAGGLVCLAILAARNWLQPLVVFAPDWVARLLTPRGGIPYGVAIALGALLAFPSSGLLTVFAAGR